MLYKKYVIEVIKYQDTVSNVILRTNSMYDNQIQFNIDTITDLVNISLYMNENR